MGHDSENTTQNYLAFLDNSMIDKANKMILKSCNDVMGMLSKMRYLLLREGLTSAKVHKIVQNKEFFGVKNVLVW